MDRDRPAIQELHRGRAPWTRHVRRRRALRPPAHHHPTPRPTPPRSPEPPTRPPLLSREHWLRERTAWIVAAIVAGVSLIAIGVYLWVALHRVGYPYEVQWMEGGSVEQIHRLLHGQGIYVRPTAHFTPYGYPPLYWWVSAAVAWFTGVGFLPLRLVSLLASIGCLGALAYLVKREGHAVPAALAAAGLYAATFRAAGAWFDIARVDSLFLFLLLVAIALARRAATRPDPVATRAAVAAGVLLALAFLTKQSALVAGAPVIGALLILRRRAGVAMATSCLGVSVAAAGLLHVSTHGWYSRFVLGLFAQHDLIHQAVVGYWRHDIFGAAGVALALSLLALVCMMRRGPEGRRDALWWGAVLGGLLLASWIAKIHSGSYDEDLMPAYAGLALAAALGWAEVRRLRIRLSAWRRVPAAWLAMLAVPALVVVQFDHLRYQPTQQVPTSADRRSGERLIAWLRARPGALMAPGDPWYTAMAGKGTSAQEAAVSDIFRARDEPLKRELRASLDAAFADPRLKTVLLDGNGDQQDLYPELGRWFHRVVGQGPFDDPRAFLPLTDIRVHPDWVWVRNE
jgi:hypothetical protein